MRRTAISMMLVSALGVGFVAGCGKRAGVKTTVKMSGTLAELRNVRPDLEEVKVEQGLEQAMQNYRRYIEETPETALTPEAMRRLADLQLEKQFGIRAGNTKPREMAAPSTGQALAGAPANGASPAAAVADSRVRESDQDFERRTTAEGGNLANNADTPTTDAARAGADDSGP